MKSYRVETSANDGMRTNDAGARSSSTRPELSLWRIYALRVAYLILAVGLGVYVWPKVIQHGSELAATGGIRLSMLAGLGAVAALGLRYPVRMVPLLLFELSWKAIYLIGFALPLWGSHQMTETVQEDVNSVLMVVILLPLVPWRYVFDNYLQNPGDKWK